ncbi:L-arabinose transport system permease protein AraQ [Eisenbergiella tayi]|uniref:L-arabinose transport system permease protein AraQ n=1 Tax=Eisenbergiella tayi TaxID=1432052 RepID=A0A1E3ATX4_9FIRM|nr:carbohydrate ABC transporter permease [Eisenbergiella tayi]ODM12092.1 L-arabinose transport system permease protein AraQ [Eisenbergiella tayi]
MAEKQVMESRKVKMGTAAVIFNVIGYILVGLVALICLLPFIMLVSGSFSSEQAIRFTGYGMLPKDFTLEAYKVVFKYPEKIVRAYRVSIFITAVGTGIGLFITTMAAYVISRKDFKYRNAISFFFYFTTLFNGGMVSTYIFYIQYLHLKDNLLALILPGMVNIFYLLIMRSFVSAIPIALVESAKIDGAGEFRTFLQIVLPLLKSGLATIGLFMALGYWNDWYNAMLYMNTSEKYPLQYMLYDLLQQTQALARIASQAGIRVESLPSNTLKLAMAVVATGPIILLYPFVQKYFVKGVTIGSVKG